MDGDHQTTTRVSGPAGEAALLVALRDVHKSVSVAADLVTFTADPATLGEAVCDLVDLRNRLDGLCVAINGAADRAGVAIGAGQRTIAQYVAARTNTDPAVARRDVTLARWLRDLPELEAALADGVLSRSHLQHLRTKVDSPRSHFELVGDQAFFVETARTCSFDGFVVACDYWLVHIDPDGEEPQEQLENNACTVRAGRGGRRRLDIDLDALSGQALQTMIDHEAGKLRNGDDANGVTRSESKRRAAAVLQLALRGFQRPDGTLPVPLINVVMSLQVAEWARGRLLNPTADRVPVAPDDVDGRCELIDGTPVHPLLVMAATGLFQVSQPVLRRHVMEADSRLLDVSVNARSFPEWQRTAHLVQSRGSCTTHGCDAPHRWLQIDHVDPVHNGGRTEFWNGQPHCGADNSAKGASTGQVPWRDRPRPRFRPGGSGHRGSPDDSDGDAT